MNFAGLPPLCTKEQVRALGVTGEDATLDLLIAASSAAVRQACGWAISAESAAVLPGRGTGSKVVTLPTLWLTAVHSVSFDGVAVDPVPEWTIPGVLLIGASYGTKVVANVDHGYDPTPDDLALTVAGMVARTVASPVGVVGERVGAWSVNYDASPFAPNASRSAVRVTPGDLDTLAPYMLPKVP